MEIRKEEKSALARGLTHDQKIRWDSRAFDVAGARRWVVQQLAKEVVKRLREQDDDELKS
jgi:hypothetical protein